MQRAHDLADVLHLAALAFVVGDAARLAHGVAEILGHRHAFERIFGQRDERFAQLLQRVHVALQLGFARTVVAVFVGLALVVAAGIDRLNAGFTVHPDIVACVRTVPEARVRVLRQSLAGECTRSLL